MKTQKVEFQPPKDASLPEGVQPGEDWDMVCSFRIGANSQICMTNFGDTDMPGYDKSESSEKKSYAKEDKPGYGDMASGMMGSMGG